MAKRKVRGGTAVQSRPAPQRRAIGSAAWFCSPDAFKMFVGNGYKPLAQCPDVMMCVHKYADLISSMTIHLMENTDQGDKRINNELSRKVDISPYKLMTRKSWMYNIIRTLLLEGDGNQVTVPHYDNNGLLSDLEPLPPSSVSIVMRGNSYSILSLGREYSPDEVLHFVSRPDPEMPWMGTGLRTSLNDVVSGLKQAADTKMAIMSSPTPSIIIKVDGFTQEFQTREGRDKLRAQYLDSSENGLPWFIPAETFDIETIQPLTLNDLAIQQGMELDKKTVAGVFSMPPFMLGVGAYNKEEYNHFVTTSIMPMAQNIEQELTRKLIYSSNMYWRLNPRSLLSYNMDELTQLGGQMVDRTAMTRNEWRDLLGFDPRDDMEELLSLENYIPASRLGDQDKLK